MSVLGHTAKDLPCVTLALGKHFRKKIKKKWSAATTSTSTAATVSAAASGGEGPDPPQHLEGGEEAGTGSARPSLTKGEQWERTAVCAPESTTRSLMSSPLAANLAASSKRLNDGRGRNWSAPLEVDKRPPSRRPAGTMKLTPPLLRTALASRAAKARTSAQETLSGHAALAASTTTKPCSRIRPRRGRGGRAGGRRGGRG